MIKSGIYKIINQVNGRFYIGSAVNIKKRWRYHIEDLNKGKHGNSHLQKAWSKYGGDNFTFEILEHCELLYLISREQYYLDNTGACENGYNICPVAGSKLGTKMPLEAIRKLKEANKGRKATDEARRNMSLARMGRRVSEETKRKISDSHKGKVPSPETRIKLSIVRKKRVTTDATRLKMSRTRTGMKVVLSDKAKENMKNGAINRKSSKGFKRKPISEEHRLKLSIATTNYWRRKKQQ